MRLITKQKNSGQHCNEYRSYSHNGTLNFQLKKIGQAITIIIVVSASVNYAFGEDYFSPNSLSAVDGVNVADIQNLDHFQSRVGNWQENITLISLLMGYLLIREK